MPVRSTPFPGWPDLGAAEADAARDVLLSNRLIGSSGPHVADFESAFAQASGAPHCVAVSSGTTALHAVLTALGVGPGDEVLVPAYTFVASASPVAHLGAVPVFVDIDPFTYCMSPVDAERKITPRTRVIIAVHLNGHPAPLAELGALAARHELELVEDAAQAHGARFDGRPVGTFGVAGVFSFWQDKTITTGGEGGAVVTSDPELAETVRRLRNHGEAVLPGGALRGHVLLGHNFRLTAAQAAVGTVQVGRLAGFVERRRANAAHLTAALAGVRGIRPPAVGLLCEPSPWKYVCRLVADPGRLALPEFLAALQAEGVPAQRRYPIPLHRQPVFAGPGTPSLKVAEHCATTLFSLPVHPTMETTDLDDCARAIELVLAAHGVDEDVDPLSAA